MHDLETMFGEAAVNREHRWESDTENQSVRSMKTPSSALRKIHVCGWQSDTMQRTSLVVLVGLVAVAGCNAFSGWSDITPETPPVTPMDVLTEPYDCKQTTDGPPTTSRASADDNNGSSNRLVIREHATWVPTPSRNDQPPIENILRFDITRNRL
jgi:hypothetical protein